MKRPLSSIVATLGKNRFNTIYDIGANRGQWVKQARQVFPNSRFICFEANNLPRPSTLSPTDDWYDYTLVTDSPRTVLWHNNNSTGDSYYKEKTRFYANSKVVKRVGLPLTEHISKLQLPLPNMMKLDTQGSELDILKGCTDEILRECLIIRVEVPLFEYNEGSPRFQEYIDYITSRCYVPVEVEEIHYCSNILNQFDILFIKRGEFVKHYEDKNRVLVRDLIDA